MYSCLWGRPARAWRASLRLGRTLGLLATVLLVACAPAAAPSPTTVPAKATEAAKPAASPAASPAPVASPSPAASPSPGAAVGATKPAGPAPKTTSGYPSRAIDLVVAFGAGGGTDLTARILATHLQERWGVPINVLNLPGASGQTGSLRLMQSAPDGYTMMMDTHGSSSLMAVANPQLPFDWKARTWVARVNLDPVFYATQSDSPWKNLDDVVAAAKGNPDQFVWGSVPSGIGTWSVAQLMVAREIPIAETNRVSFNSGAEAATALAGGQVQLASQLGSEVKPLAAAGRIKVIAAVAEQRSTDFPDVATAAEQGYPQLNMVGWHGVTGPPNLPAEMVEFWTSELEQVTRSPEFVRQAEQAAKQVGFLRGPEFQKYVEDQYQAVLPLAAQMSSEP